MGRVTGILFAAAMGALVLANAQGGAQAATEDQSSDPNYAVSCAADYMALIGSQEMQKQVSNLDKIRPGARVTTLTERFDLDERRIADESVNRNFGPMSIYGPLSAAAGRGLAAKLLVEILLAECDRTFGFEPVIQWAGASPSAAAQLTHRQCATSYFTLALLAPHVQSVLRPRIKQAASADAGQTITDQGVHDRLSGDGRKRGLSIRSGQERLEPLVAEVRACDAQYGHQPVKLQ